MNGELAKKYLSEYADKKHLLVEKHFQALAKEEKTPLITDAIYKLAEISKEGKGIRGALVILGYELSGKKATADIYELSLVLELFHAGILVQDDVMDNDSLRRGLPTIHKQYEKIAEKTSVMDDASHYGISMAINLSDMALLSLLKIISKSKLKKENLLKALEIYADYTTRVVFGQIMDITNHKDKKIDLEKVLKIHRFKTAEYTGVLPILFGASLAGISDKKTLLLIEQYGLCLGSAFQIQDDIIGTFGKENEIGKNAGSDIREGKNTILVIDFLKNSDTEKQRTLMKYLGKKDLVESEISLIQNLFKSSGSYDRVIKLGWNYIEKGLKYLKNVTSNPKTSEKLESLIVYMMERTK